MKLHTISLAISLICLTAGSVCIDALQAQPACDDPTVVCVPKGGEPKGREPPTGEQTRPGASQQPRPDQGPLPPVQGTPSRPQQSGQNPVPRQESEIQGVPVPGSGFSAPANVAERALQRKIGPEKFNEIMGGIENLRGQAGPGKGASNADRHFDVAPPRTGNDDHLRPAGNRFFQSGGVEIERSGNYRSPTPQSAQDTLRTYKGIPGGVVLEGAATGLGSLDRVAYNKKLNALMLDDRAAYFFPILPESVAVLCRALDRDDRIGVSLGQVHIVYGALPPDSNVAIDLKLADHFLGDIVFARKDWTRGYRLANGFEPQPHRGDRFYGAVFFKFNGFQFHIDQEEVRLIASNFDVQVVPLLDTKTTDGGHLPDVSAISASRTSPQWESNARHIAQNASYYGKEKIVDRVFQYGEVAALLRGLKAAGVDLNRLARAIEFATGTAAASPSAAPPQVNPARQLENDWLEYLKQIQAHNYYPNWSGPPYDVYTNAKSNSFVTYLHRDIHGNDVRAIFNTNLATCSSECQSNAQCQAYSFDRWNRWCFLKGGLNTLTLDPRSVTGVRQHLSQPENSTGSVQMYHYRRKAFQEGKVLQTAANFSLDSCEQSCVINSSCIAYTFLTTTRRCILLSDAGEYFTNPNAHSGAKQQE
jgi:PAN domain-containing protein